MRTSTIVTALLALAATALGQDPDSVLRGRAFGEARAADGTPWAGAEVCFLSRAWTLWSEDDDSSDLVVTHTDARGRFGAQLLVGRRYRSWARAATDDGRVLFSTEVAAVQAGERLELVAGTEPVGPTTVRLTGLGDLGARRVRALEPQLGSRELRVETTGTDADTFRLPPTPTRSVHLLVLEADGRPVLDARFPSDGGTHVVAPGEPSWLRARVFDVDAQKPIPGARIVWNQLGRTVELARTGDDGTAALDLSFLSTTIDGTPHQQGPMHQAVVADGWHLGMLQIEDVRRGRGSRRGLDADDRIDAECRPKPVETNGLNGRLVIGGQPAADWPLVVTATAWHRDDAANATGIGSVLVVRTDADGVFRLDGLSDGDQPFDLVLGARQLEVLPAAWRRGLPARISLPLPRGDGTPVSIDLLADLRVVDVQVTAHRDGLPAAGATVHYGSSDHGGLVDARTDRVGRARLLIHAKSDQPLFITARGGDDPGWTAVEVSRAQLSSAPADRPPLIPLELRANASVRSKLVRPDGVPADARVWIYPSIDWGPFQFAATPPRRELRDGALFEVLTPDEVPPTLIGALADGIWVDGGEFVIELPRLPITWVVNAWLQHDQASYAGQVRFENGEDAAATGLELELHRQ